MQRSYYADDIERFCATSKQNILGILAQNNEFDLNREQRDAWTAQIEILQPLLKGYRGRIFFEYTIPRMGRRIDVLLVIQQVIFILEFKIGEGQYSSYAIDQVWDYALDLKNFHETSHSLPIAPILFASEAKAFASSISLSPADDLVFSPILSNAELLPLQIQAILNFAVGAAVNLKRWEEGRYQPSPSIIEAALALYNGHSVDEISRSDATAINLQKTTDSILEILEDARTNKRKAICFVTGVPGAGKTLVGLNIATKRLDEESGLKGIFLSGNGPLVAVLTEALARDMVAKGLQEGGKTRISDARRKVKSFVQNVHHFRDEYLIDHKAPYNKIAIFDEAQRAWNLDQTAKFMKNKKNRAGFTQSEAEFLISCMDRHEDWAAIICLVGGGQEINTGEAGISEWINCMLSNFQDWNIYLSDRLTDNEYDAGNVLHKLRNRPYVKILPELHLSVSMRSFRAENVSKWVKQVLDMDSRAKDTLVELQENYPIALCRDISQARAWLKSQARGSERYGIVVSSQAYRLKPLAIDVRHETDPIHWFLNGKDDVRSSYYLEDVATEFQVQGLELDWVCVTWDGDFRCKDGKWDYWSFKGNKWQQIRKAERKIFLKNAYRVLLTRARQGMIIVVPEGSDEDPSRSREYYDETYEYLQGLGLKQLVL